jgi:hypothetical protein
VIWGFDLGIWPIAISLIAELIHRLKSPIGQSQIKSQNHQIGQSVNVTRLDAVAVARA